MLHLPRNSNFDLRATLHLPRNPNFDRLATLHLPRNSNFGLHAALHLPRNPNFDLRATLHLDVYRCFSVPVHLRRRRLSAFRMTEKRACLRLSHSSSNE